MKIVAPHGTGVLCWWFRVDHTCPSCGCVLHLEVGDRFTSDYVRDKRGILMHRVFFECPVCFQGVETLRVPE